LAVLPPPFWRREVSLVRGETTKKNDEGGERVRS